MPIKQITLDGVKTPDTDKFEMSISEIGSLKGSGKDTVGEFTINGKFEVNGKVALVKTYKDGKTINGLGLMSFPAFLCDYKGADGADHKLEITFSIKKLECVSSIFGPFEPIPEPTKSMGGIAFAEEGGADKTGAWGVIALEPRVEVGKRHGKVYFLDGKVVEVKIEISESSMNLVLQDKILTFFDIAGF
jgi:hypothetical protein